MASIHLIFKEDSEISSFLFLFGGIIVSGSDVMSLKDWIQESNNIVFFGGVRQFGAKYLAGGNPVW